MLALENRSEHPLADAVVANLKEEGVAEVSIDDFVSHTGRGIQAHSGNTLYAVGNQRFLEEHKVKISPSIEVEVAKFETQAKTVVFFTADDTVLSIIAIADKIKETSRTAIEQLRSKGIDVYMLTGDNEQTARAVALQVGLAHYKSNMLPEDKSQFIKSLQKEGKIVAMVGDGINDSQALAQANVSIAMGKGSDIAMDVATMTLITSDLRSVVKALNLSTNTIRGIRQNLFWAFIYNLIGIPLAAGILYPINGFLLNPMIAGAAMALSSVSVVANSLRLKLSRI